VQHHGRGDQREHRRHHQRRTRIAGGLQPQSRHTRHRRRNNAARRDPAGQQPLRHGQAAAQRGDQDGQRPHHHQHRQRQQADRPGQRRKRGTVEVGGQGDEQRRDDQHHQGFLEAAQLGGAGDVQVGQRDAEQRRRDQPGIGHHQVRRHVHAKGEDQQHRRLQHLRHLVAGEREAHQEAGADAQCHGDRQALQQRPREVAGQAGDQGFQHQRCQDGADRVVDDRLPFQERGGAALQPHMAQQRQHHGRAGDHGDRPVQRRRPPGDAGQRVRGQGAERPAARQRQRGQPQDTLAGGAQLAEIERQAAFEHDDRHRQADDRAQRGAEGLGGGEQLEAGAGQQADDEQQHDRRQPQAPGQPLCRDAAHRDAEHRDRRAVFHARVPAPLTGEG
jgi:hypothetical protein